MNSDDSIIQQCLAEIQNRAEELSRFPIRFDIHSADSGLVSSTEVAWKRGLNYHVIKTNESLSLPEKHHAKAHELYHIILEAEARAHGSNRFINFNQDSHLCAVEDVVSELDELLSVYPKPEELGPVIQQVIEETVALLYNIPLDIIIEDLIYKNHAVLAEAQRAGEIKTLKLNLASISDQTNRRFLPASIIGIKQQLYAAYALSADRRWNGELAAFHSYDKIGDMGKAPEIFNFASSTAAIRSPGSEYDLIARIGEELNMTSWFAWKDD